VLERLQRLTRRQLLSGLTLGGGTLIGHAELRRPFEELWRRYPDLPAFTFGSGVEDPALDRSGVSAAKRQDELARWGEMLGRFSGVSVRGPRSAALLRAVGFEPEVVGDSALLLHAMAPPIDPEARVLGLNAGIAGAIWGGQPDRVIDEIAEVARVFARRGWEVRLFSMWPADEPYLHEVARRAGVAVRFEFNYTDTRALLGALRRCTVFAGLKLHSTVLATAVGTPAVMIEYQPKCADFQESVGRAEWSVKTDVLTADRLVEMLDQLAASRDLQSAQITSAVDKLCTRVLEFSARVTRRVMRS
jgi:polysaccharide pyruvyl transferase WcaK-like protein